MAKDHFQDIVPPSRGHHREKPRHVPISVAQESDVPDEPLDEREEPDIDPPSPDRSIRNVNIVPTRPRRTLETPSGNFGMHKSGKRRNRRWLWIIAGISAVVLGILLLLALRSTTVTIIPKTHAVVFDQSSQFTAYPALVAASGTLAYSVQTVDLDDSDTVQSAGTVHADDKASGAVTVVNEYSTAPVTLIKNTRFSTPDGLIFRAPADIVVPGKTAAGSGKVTVTVVADQAGQAYNVGPIQKLTVPGLKSTPDMYAHVYATASAAFTGGFSGDKPGVSDADMQKTVAAIRSRLEGKARDAVKALQSDTNAVFPDLVLVQYSDEPSTQEAGGDVRIHEKAHVVIPLFKADDLATAVASSVSSDAEGAGVFIVPGQGYGAHMTSDSATLGTDPMTFTLLGNATIVWRVDTTALAQALAGRDQSAFQNIVTGFPGIQEAHARIEPFWASAFPKNPGAIKIAVQNPTE